MWVGICLSSLKLAFSRDRNYPLPSIDEGTTYTVKFSQAGELSYTVPYAQQHTEGKSVLREMDLSDTSLFNPNGWRISHQLGFYSWEFGRFIPFKMQGEAGDFRMTVSVNCYEGDLKKFILDSYEEYFNGPDGRNTEVRQSPDFGQDLTDEELGPWIVHVPESLDVKMVNAIEFLHWSVSNEFQQRPHLHFAYALTEDKYVLFTFSYWGTDELKDTKLKLVDDIMKRVSIQI